MLPKCCIHWYGACGCGLFFLGFSLNMATYHDEIEIEDMEYDDEKETYYYPCPCGDRFEITKVKRSFCCDA